VPTCAVVPSHCPVVRCRVEVGSALQRCHMPWFIDIAWPRKACHLGQHGAGKRAVEAKAPLVDTHRLWLRGGGGCAPSPQTLLAAICLCSRRRCTSQAELRDASRSKRSSRPRACRMMRHVSRADCVLCANCIPHLALAAAAALAGAHRLCHTVCALRASLVAPVRFVCE
jgi:hypothetical protein